MTYVLVVEHVCLPQSEQRGSLESFYDNDPGYGKGYSITAKTGENKPAFDLDNMKPGAHVLYVRSQDDEGRWFSTASIPLYVCHQIDITAMEYFFDSKDPGQGRAIAVLLPTKHSTVVVFKLTPRA